MNNNTTDRTGPNGRTDNDEESPAVDRDDFVEKIDAIGDLIDKPAIRELIKAFHKHIELQSESSKKKIEHQEVLHRENSSLMKRAQWFWIGSLALILMALILIMWLFRDKEQVLIPIVTATIGLVCGLTGSRSSSVAKGTE